MSSIFQQAERLKDGGLNIGHAFATQGHFSLDIAGLKPGLLAGAESPINMG